MIYNIRDFYELTKPRLSYLALFTALLAYFISPNNYETSKSTLIFIFLTLGTAFCAGGAAVLNQWLEYDPDSIMVRTKNRPIPTKRIIPKHAFIFGITLSFLGLVILYFGVSLFTALLALSSISIYILIYTPLKKSSSANTIVGAFPGAIPPLIGWSAAEGIISLGGWYLFAILFFWQLPHFYALSWIYKNDYKNANFKMLSVGDTVGNIVSKRSFLYTIILTIVTYMPLLFHSFKVSFFYIISCTILNLYFLIKSFNFIISDDKNKSARELFLSSITYLPLIFLVLLIDKLILSLT